jgi:hypothetical protein
MPTSLDEKTWEMLLNRISDGKCTPFLGAGASYGLLPLAGDVARRWAIEYKYPFPDSSDLAKLAQYVALNYDRMVPKENILKIFAKEAVAPDFKDPLQPHRILAELSLPIYLTTNYDNLMTQALESRHKDPRRELCRWNKLLEKHESAFDKKQFKPTVANPVVFHLHGHSQVPESLVLTEDDYLDFLVNLSSLPNLIPAAVRGALEKTTLLFIGYRIVDWNFRVLMRGISRYIEPSLKRINIAVMLPPRPEELTPSEFDAGRRKAQEYMDKYYQSLGIQVYWGTAAEFVSELKQRLDLTGWAG